MIKTALALLVGILFILVPLGADSASNSIQVKKERSLVEMLKKLVTCKNQGVYEGDGDLYCFLSFRGLQLEFAGVNRKGGGAIYVTALGKNQTLSSRGSRCLEIAFGDKDLRGVIDAHILFRNDGTIKHTTNYEETWVECQ